MTRKRASTTEMAKRLALLEQGLKYCKHCEQTKDINDFGKDARHSDGLQTFCKSCCNELKRTKWGDKIRATARRRHHEHKERFNKQKREYMRKNRAYFGEKTREWKAANRARYIERKRRYHQAHRIEENEAAKIRAKKWRLKNPERFMDNIRRRVLRKRNAEGYHTTEQWLKLLDLCGSKCVACGSEEGLTRDHIIPLDWNGSDWIDNIQPLCKPCNCTKQDVAAVDYRPPLARAWAYLESIPWQPVCNEPLPIPQRTEERLALND